MHNYSDPEGTPIPSAPDPPATPTPTPTDPPGPPALRDLIAWLDRFERLITFGGPR
jgi:hypothetical protein